MKTNSCVQKKQKMRLTKPTEEKVEDIDETDKFHEQDKQSEMNFDWVEVYTSAQSKVFSWKTHTRRDV